jgi:Amt family ammonium transporter
VSHFLRRRGALAASLLAFLPGLAYAQDAAGAAPEAAAPAAAPAINSGDTGFILLCAALVLFMTPGLALFYGGMVRRKNALSTILQSFIAMGLISVLWVVVGYSIAFSKGGDFVGGLEWLGLNGVSATEPHSFYMTTVPHQAFMVYQLMFAIITPALITGAFAERIKFSSYLVMMALWSLLVYCPIAHWVWAEDGWLMKKGAMDFAGGTVVHISSGVTALVAAIMMGKRRGYPGEEMRPHNLTMTLVGTGILWFGWFGFNAGSAGAANGLAVTAFVNTHFATAAAAVAWMLIEWAHRGKPTALGVASGAVAGLVGITPAAGFVPVLGALAIGALASAACYAAVMFKGKFGYDDSLDTFGVHGVGGTVGALLTGVFSLKAVNELGKDGLLKGGVDAFVTQVIGVGATWIYAIVVGGLILLIVDKTMGLRVKSTDEEAGLDLSQHGEEAYLM